MAVGIGQCVVAVVAIGIRFFGAGWWMIFAMFTLGIVPAVIVAPVIVAGFLAPPEALPLLVVADVLLLAAASTAPDMGDNPEYQFPLRGLLTGYPGLPVGDPRSVRLCGVARWSAWGYLAAVLVLLVWTCTGH
ncbi:hypothetical protein [Nocardia sp. NBC_00416]|uniref:hypothetical protein n=1 Tax=Nocardia sp. NBC_00416 TaxID=2975991 RepID=UPI002E21CD26